VAKQCQDVHTNLLSMMLVAGFMREYSLDNQIAKCSALYKEKCGRMISALERSMDSRVTFTRPEGGLFIWGTLPRGYSGTELCAYTGKRSLAIVPGMAFDTAENPDNPGFRLNFSVPSFEEIDKGTLLLSDSVREYLGMEGQIS